MNNSFLTVLVGIILVAGVGGFVFWQKNFSKDVIPQVPSNDSTSNSWVRDAANNIAQDDDVSDDVNDDVNDDNPTPGVQGFGATSGGTAPAPAPVGAGISAATVAEHGSRSSCWATINSSVYDLTSWIPKHPGGEQAILQLCGTDGSAKFNGQHGGQAKQAAVLAGFKIGVLAN